MPRNVLIVGPPRTGTSLAASIFARSGYSVGEIERDRYREGDDHNPFGYFEADAVIERNVEVLHRAEFEQHNTWRFEPISREAAERVWDLAPSDQDRRFVQEYERRAPWLWKDPRLCFTLPYWWKLMDPGRTRVLLVRRDAADVYQSYRRKGWCGRGEEERRAVADRLEQHLRAARHAVVSLGIPHTTIDYAEYADGPEELARRLGAVFELQLTREHLNFRAELDHSNVRGRFSTRMRHQLKRLPREPLERLAGRIPRRLLGLVFPERKYYDGSR